MPMLVRRWHEEPVEELTPLLGRQLLHTETMTIGRILLAAGASSRATTTCTSRSRTCSRDACGSSSADDEQIVSAGESVFIPSEIPHSVEALEDSVVLDVFSPCARLGERRRRVSARIARCLTLTPGVERVEDSVGGRSTPG